MIKPSAALTGVGLQGSEIAFAQLSELTAEKWQFSLGSKLMGQINLVQEAIPFITKRILPLISGVLKDEPILRRRRRASSAVLPGAFWKVVCSGVSAIELEGLRINVVSPTS